MHIAAHKHRLEKCIYKHTFVITEINTWPGAMVSLSHFFLELIKHNVVYLISALSIVWDCHFNLLEFGYIKL